MRCIPMERRDLGIALLLTVLISSLGCINLAANLIHAVKGNNRPAEFDGLKGKRVAVVCATDSGLGKDAINTILTNNIEAALSMNVEEIDVVSSREISQWLDVHGWDDSDYIEIGKGVKADRVLAVDVLNMSLRNGPTLYRGQADVSLTVYDVQDGRKLYQKDMIELAFPERGGKPVTETTESKFRSFFLAVLTRKIGGLFYEDDATADVALDATISSF